MKFQGVPGKCAVTLMLIWTMAALLDVLPCCADVCFIHDYTMNEYVVGEKDAELSECYSGNSKAVDKTTRYTDTLLKRWFGGVKSFKATTQILLDQDVIRELDYAKNKTIDFPLKKITDPAWYDRYTPDDIPESTREHLDKRYAAVDPEFDVQVDPEPVLLNGYSCRHVVALLRLETRDKKRNASSITLVRQEVWVSEDVPGYDEYQAFHRKLVDRLGIDAERIGVFASLLDYWQGPLDRFRDALGDVQGYPVHKEVSVTAVYRADSPSGDPVTTQKEISAIKETLRSVSRDPVPSERFASPPEFSQVIAE
ncbi:MAG: hypothetical protein V1793_17625 [Pseudomonadota bacterium]